MRIAIFSKAYPSREDKYNYSFVHLRAKLYKKAGHEVKVFVIGKEEEYFYEGISVVKTKEVMEKVMGYNPDTVCVHSPQKFLHNDFDMFKQLNYLMSVFRITVWCHGFESLSFKHYPLRIASLKDLIKYPYIWYTHKVQLKEMRKLAKIVGESSIHKLVFVSEWMKEKAEESLGLKLSNSLVIPNPVDEELFKPVKKCVDQRFKMLSIRPFDNKKYANDLTIKTLSLVSKGSLDLYGKGKNKVKWESLVKELKANVNIIEGFIDHEKIPELHKKYGLYVSPSRADAQGVSMCEAMCSGLPVITSNVGGIPEFVKEGMGFVCDSVEEMAGKIIFLQAEPDVYKSMSEFASEKIREICGSKIIIEKELEILKR